jgi:hypothetical protein
MSIAEEAEVTDTMKSTRQNMEEEATDGEDRRPVGQARPVLLVVTGGKPSDAAAFWKHASADRRAADWIGAAASKRMGRKQGEPESCPKNRFKIRRFLVFCAGRGGAGTFLGSSERPG